jgi:3D-(3,5/4)-trihydroxycyclohexane-1,2-dione acylhydrolase (decyclizing)
MGTIRLTMTQALLKFMDNQFVSFDGKEEKFVEGIFGIFGHGCVVGIGQALEQGGHGLTFYQGKNEQGMAHSAIGFAKEHNRRKIIPVTTSVGPGALNLVPAAGTATANRIPLLLLPGDTFATRQPDPVLQQLEFPSSMAYTANDAFKAVCKYWDRIQRPEQLMTACINAFRVLTDWADTGAVCIAMPQDVEGEAYDYPEYFFQKRVWYMDRRPITQTALDRAVEAIKKAKRPMLICGGGVKYSEAWNELASFAADFNLPFGETQSGKGIVAWDHPCNMGGLGLTGTSAANKLAKEADLVIGVGTKFMDFTTCSKWLFQDPDVQYISINVGSMDAYKMDAIPVIADAKVALEAIGAELKKDGYKSAYSATELADTAAEWTAECDRLYSLTREDGRLATSHVLGILNKHLRPQDVILTAGGSLPSDLQRVWRSGNPGTYHVEYGFSCMGYEVCGAVGAKMAVGPDREIYVVVGDGSYVLMHSEIYTAVQEGLKLNILVIDNSGWGCIENLQNNNGTPTFGTVFKARNPETNQLDGPNVVVDFAKNGESYGAKGYNISTEAELLAALADAKTQSKVCVFDVKVAPGTMTGGYGGWWRVGIAEVSTRPSVQKCYEAHVEEMKNVRQY